MNPKNWNEAAATTCALMLITQSETKSQAVMATLDFCISLVDAGCDLHMFRKTCELHSKLCKEIPNN